MTKEDVVIYYRAVKIISHDYMTDDEIQETDEFSEWTNDHLYPWLYNQYRWNNESPHLSYEEWTDFWLAL